MDEVISYQGNVENSYQTGDVRQVYFTFDDGPSEQTEEILDVLKQYNVKATFFVVGRTDERSKELYRRIVDEGHAIGLHSYSHKYSDLYASKEAFPLLYNCVAAFWNALSFIDVYKFLAVEDGSDDLSTFKRCFAHST